jgi:hypothetical protein
MGAVAERSMRRLIAVFVLGLASFLLLNLISLWASRDLLGHRVRAWGVPFEVTHPGSHVGLNPNALVGNAVVAVAVSLVVAVFFTGWASWIGRRTRH